MTALVVFVLASTPAIERAAQEVATLAAARGFAPPVGLFVEGTPAALPRAFASLVAANLENQKLAPVVVEARDAGEAERTARAQGLVSLARLTLVIEGTRLFVRGDIISTRVNFWSAEVPTRTGPAAVVAIALDSDAQLLALAGPTAPGAPLELRATTATRLSAWPAAMGAGDLDGDKRAELAVVSGDKLTVYGDSRVLARGDFSQPLALRPTREPFGFVGVSPGRLVTWSARRERAEGWSWTRSVLRSTGAVDALTADSIALKSEAGFNHYSPDVTWATKTMTAPLPIHAVSTFGALALFVFTDGSAAIARGVAPSSRVTSVGSGAALADLDGDGTPEVVVTNARAVGEFDELKVFTLSAFEGVQAHNGLISETAPLAQLALKGRAVVATAGDFDGDGTDEIALGLWLNDGTGELVIVRRVAP